MLGTHCQRFAGACWQPAGSSTSQTASAFAQVAGRGFLRNLYSMQSITPAAWPPNVARGRQGQHPQRKVSFKQQ